MKQRLDNIAYDFNNCDFGQVSFMRSQFLDVLKQILASRLLKNVSALPILHVGNLLNYVWMHRDPLREVDMLPRSRTSLHDEQVQYLLIFDSLHLV